jgi:hypothetical protein
MYTMWKVEVGECKHPYTTSEVAFGSRTGDRQCPECGLAMFPGDWPLLRQAQATIERLTGAKQSTW